ncbi:MAG: response regulator transcription factor [Schleiferiaceae bacterium]|jgi:two-component system OmpR family response regulator|tara:strand:- start:3739 stop:4425 length:687 start_codon:yes stop_codon:yes gene_type:complete
MEKQRILLVEDDVNFGNLLRDTIAFNDYEVDLERDGVQGLRAYKQGDYDLCIFDIMMPKKDGLTLATEVKEIDNGQPLIFLTAKGQKEDIIAGYSAGADDYLVKPFDTDVLLYKIQAIIGRKSADTEEEADELIIASFTFMPKIRQLVWEGEVTRLSPKESELLKMLVAHKNQLLPRSKALLKIWREDNYFTGRSMDVYVAKLRKYLKVDSTLRIENVHGEGFRLVQE